MSRLLKMTCSQEDGQEEIVVYAVTRGENTIEGIVFENELTRYCIKGIMLRSGEIAFLMVSCNDKSKIPCVFVFEDNGKGYVSKLELFYGFNKWVKDWKVKVEEIEDNHMLRNVATRYRHRYISLDEVGKSLMENYEELQSFF